MSESSLVPEPMFAEQVSVNASTAVHQSAKSIGSSRRTVDVVPTSPADSSWMAHSEHAPREYIAGLGLINAFHATIRRSRQATAH
jgi:hypothetical protein